MTTDNRFGLRLKQLRNLRGHSQDRLAELTGLSSDAISNLERGINLPGLDTVDVLRTALDVQVWELLDYMGTAPAPDPARQRLETRLLTTVRQLDRDLLETAVEQAESLLKYAKRGE
ncbi:helix-turn-helix domain-containing protein [Niveispirillum sp. KHB5.9]|uniref:helix-turn-helix domain-containing protein n=1 Tax=Niveispirillum sp. KHB5.9 TaxID=3400269 RepID=UPI003A897573